MNKYPQVYLSSSAARPGRTFPSRSSSDAPPPVETKVTLSSMSHLAAAVAESPPPMMPAFPAAVVSATASRRAFVPAEKLSNSNTPAGPFQITVADASTVSRKSAIDFGPQSIPSHPSGMPSSCVTILMGWSFLKSCPHAQSQGSTILHPFSSAFFRRPGASSAPFLSKRDLPISIPKHVLRKVYAMPPQMMMLSLLSIKLSITRTLSEILAPPTIDVSGVFFNSGSRTFEKAWSSLASSRPETQGILPCIPTIDECALWAVPNASHT
mmetsp:Transcript_62132/g.183641  ORF Transcript_62132/g.183641 Transcript_62132/m.183641 type:complete len:268 (-) Transcript_62132:577-1380(-)